MAVRERLRNGILYAVLGYVVWVIAKKFAKGLWESTESLRRICRWMLKSFLNNGIALDMATIGATIAIILLFAWIVGGVSPSETIKRFGQWRAHRKRTQLEKKLDGKGEKLLFTARINKESFYGGYPIGFATKVYHRKNKLVCNMCFPNLGGLITLPAVPLEDLEIAEESIEELLAFYMSLGFV